MNAERIYALSKDLRASLSSGAPAVSSNSAIELLTTQKRTTRAMTHHRGERDPEHRRVKNRTEPPSGGIFRREVCAFGFARACGEMGRGDIGAHQDRRFVTRIQ